MSRQESAKSERGRRLHVLLLALLSLGLVADGVTPTALPHVSAPGPAVLAHFDAAAIAAILARANRSLAPPERQRIASAIVRYSGAYGLDPELVTAVLLVESRARPGAVSPKGAIGLMQVMPHMMEPLGLAGNAATIESNVQAGCWILADNIRRLGEEKGISAYFWGSRIRGMAYLEKVRAARAEVRSLRTS